ncbi:hypothetical protein MOV08_24710 [Streptomyces yunnanensis]|uniref:YCII-related domain-containing protein n=1 Tax=Streptomyces yunnanensis TaxID=156453 RepID=A0ABY8ABQ2_9ACTN|nr:hypothetical protein [Streptomyces yunnanensis]WEB42139.1 hypothetical protein MOV08_24710 [Streptomyces yunnanensis]
MLYLVHIHLAPHPMGIPLPLCAAAAVADASPRDAGVVHVTAHPMGGPNPVIGVYLRSETLESAEAAGYTLWRNTVGNLPCMGGWAFLRAEVPLIPQGQW